MNKKSGIVEDFDNVCDKLSSRIKCLHEEVDRMAKRTVLDGKSEMRTRKIGALEIEGTLHHDHVKDWSKSVNNLREMKKIMTRGGSLVSTKLRNKHLKGKKNLLKLS